MHKTAIHPDVVSRANLRRGGLRVFDCLNAERTAHIVVDLQNGFMAPGQVAEIATAREIVPNVNRISAALREAGGLVVYIQNTFDEVAVATWSTFFEHFCTPERRQRMIEAFSPGAFGHAIWPGLEVLPQDLKVQKRRFGAFAPGSSDLHAILLAAQHRHADRHRHGDAGVLRVDGARCDDAELQGVLHRRRQCDVQRRRTQRDAVGDGARVLRCDRHRDDGRDDRTRRRRGRSWPDSVAAPQIKNGWLDVHQAWLHDYRGRRRDATRNAGTRRQPADPSRRHDRGGSAHHPRHSQQRRRRVPLSRLPGLQLDRQLGLHSHRQAGRHHARPVHRVARRRDQPAALDLRGAAGREVPRRLGVQRRRGDLELAADLRRQVAAIRCARRADRARHRVDGRQVREGRRQDHRPDDAVSVQLPALSADPHPDRQPDAVGEGRQDLGGVRQGTLRHRAIQDHQGGAWPVRRDDAQR